MASVPEAAASQAENGNPETRRLASLVQVLQAECAQLRQTLAQAEAERDRLRLAIYVQARAAREFEDLDIPSLEAMSAGPVELLR